MGFGPLRVLNDDRIAPQSGFGAHGHRDMEIITVVLQGEVVHKDSLGNATVIPAGDIQVMSAGSGVRHEEHNRSATEPLELLQIWIEPWTTGLPPRYAQRTIGLGNLRSGWIHLVAPEPSTTDALPIRQQANVFWGTASAGETLAGPPRTGQAVFLFLVSGRVRVGNIELGPRDALAIPHAGLDLSFVSLEPSQILYFDLPGLTQA